MRDDFSLKDKETLAKRVSYRCSNPECRQPTSGPQKDPSKYINVGVAAHITAASPGGPRYNSSLSTEQRKYISNGIWLCQKCAKLIDNDPIHYTAIKLQEWKKIAEERALTQLETGSINSQLETHNAITILKEINAQGNKIATMPPLQGVPYGIDPFHIAQKLNIPIDEVQYFIDRFDEKDFLEYTWEDVLCGVSKKGRAYLYERGYLSSDTRAFVELIQTFNKGTDSSLNGYSLPPSFISHLELDEIEFLRLLFQSGGVASAFDLAILSYGATAKSLNVIKRKALKIKKISEQLQNPDREIPAIIGSSVEQTGLFEHEDMVYFFKDEKCLAFVEDYLDQNDPFFSKNPAIVLCGCYVSFIYKSINQLGEIIFDENGKNYMNSILSVKSCSHKERIENFIESMRDIGGSVLFGGKRIPDFQFGIPIGKNKIKKMNKTSRFFGDLFKMSGCSVNIAKI